MMRSKLLGIVLAASIAMEGQILALSYNPVSCPTMTAAYPMARDTSDHSPVSRRAWFSIRGYEARPLLHHPRYPYQSELSQAANLSFKARPVRNLISFPVLTVLV